VESILQLLQLALLKKDMTLLAYIWLFQPIHKNIVQVHAGAARLKIHMMPAVQPMS
jgi:hypothetical protein